MKKLLYLVTVFIGISFYSSAQVAGDYRSVGSGNWNDATKWETYNGSEWVNNGTYPGENLGTVSVTVMPETEIRITTTVPHPIANLFIGTYISTTATSGFLIFSAGSIVSLTVSGDVEIAGELRIDNETGEKTHTLFIGRNLTVLPLGWDGNETYDPECDCYIYYVPPVFQTINGDDKLGITFNTTDPASAISSMNGISFHDITFNGTGILLNSHIYISGTATFINGIVNPGELGNPRIIFLDGSTVSGASNVSYVDGFVHKTGDDTFTFPIGNEGVYAPLTVSGLGGQETFYAYYRRNSGAVQGPITDPALYSLSNCEFWSLQAPGNVVNYPYNITVGWISDIRCGAAAYITNVADITLAKWHSTNWGSHGGTGIGTNTNGSVTWSGLTSLATVTLANLGTDCRTPFGLPTSNITSNSATVNWSAETGAASYDVDYKSVYTNTWTNAATATTSTSVNLAGLDPSQTYDWRVRVNCSSSSSIYRQAQFTTPAGCSTPSRLSTTDINSNSATLNWFAVINANNYTVQYKQTTAVSWINVAAGINSLSYNLSGLSPSISYQWRVLANCNQGSGNFAQAQFTTLAVCGTINAYETNNTSIQAKAISLGTTISAGISSATDVDWFIVSTPNSSNTALKITLSTLPADYDLYVYNKSLKQVGSSAASGTADEVVTYNANARNATVYIKVVGKNGAYNTLQCYSLLAQSGSSSNLKSEPRASETGNEKTGNLDNQFYPNPASQFVSLDFITEKEGTADIQVMNSTGQLIKVYPVHFIKGYNKVKIAVADIRPGMYLVKIKSGGLNMIRRLVIAR